MKKTQVTSSRPSWLATGAICATLLLGPGCAGFFNKARPSAQKVQAQDKRLAAMKPTTPMAAKRISREDRKQLRRIRWWLNELNLPRYRRYKAQFKRSANQSRERFVLALAARLSEKNRAWELLGRHLWDKRPAIQNALRSYSTAYVAQLQRQHEEHRTYRTPQRHRVGVGNCVLSSKAFGREGAANQHLLVRVSGQKTLHVRCYLDIPRKSFGKKPLLRLKVGHATVAVLSGTRKLQAAKGGSRHIDFQVDLEKAGIYKPTFSRAGKVVPVVLHGAWDSLGTHRVHSRVTGMEVKQNRRGGALATTAFFADLGERTSNAS